MVSVAAASRLSVAPIEKCEREKKEMIRNLSTHLSAELFDGGLEVSGLLMVVVVVVEVSMRVKKRGEKRTPRETKNRW